MDICRYLDHAVLKPEMTQEEARKQIQVGIDYNCRSVCVRPCDIEMAQEMTKGTDTMVITVLDFPHGQAPAEAKEMLAELYVAKGVREIDMVMNYGLARSGCWDKVKDEVSRVVGKAHPAGVLVKVIFETSELTIPEIKKATEICVEAGADLVKTSTGFSSHGSTPEAVMAMLEAADGRIGVKPSGGVRTYETAKFYVDKGVARLGVGFGSTPVICEGEKAAKA